MPGASDRYPPETGRRRFVKGVVGSAALSGVGVAGGASVNAATPDRGGGGGTTAYYGVENVAGPAPRAMPQIPVEVDEEGYVKGRYPKIRENERGRAAAREELGGITYSADWFQYCGVQEYAGVAPEYDGDDYLRYDDDPDYDWQRSAVEAGTRIHVDDFADYATWGNGIGDQGIGKPAVATWRSQGTDEELPVLLIRSPRIEAHIEDGEGPIEWLLASADRGFVAVLNKCTHFCCVPGFKSNPYAPADAADRIFCSCHQSVYDPESIVRRVFTAYPRPEG